VNYGASPLFQAYPNFDWYAILGPDVNYQANANGTTNADWTAGGAGTVWYEYVSDYVAAHPGVHYWDIWNEAPSNFGAYPYLCSSASSSTPTCAAADIKWPNYVQMCEDAMNVIKSASGHSGDMIFGMGGLSAFNYQDIADLNANDPTGVTSYGWLESFISAGGLSYVDGICIDLYTTNPNGGNYQLGDVPSTSGAAYNVAEMMYLELQAIQEAIGNMSIMVGQFGFPAAGTTNASSPQDSNTPANQATYAQDMVAALNVWQSAPTPINIVGACWWDVISAAGVSPDWGLWDYTTTPFSPRLALQYFPQPVTVPPISTSIQLGFASS